MIIIGALVLSIVLIVYMWIKVRGLESNVESLETSMKQSTAGVQDSRIKQLEQIVSEHNAINRRLISIPGITPYFQPPSTPPPQTEGAVCRVNNGQIECDEENEENLDEMLESELGELEEDEASENSVKKTKRVTKRTITRPKKKLPQRPIVETSEEPIELSVEEE